MLCGQDEPCAALSFDIGTGLLEPWRCVKIARRGGAVQLRSNASDKENRRRGRGRVDDRRRRCLKIGNDGEAARSEEHKSETQSLMRISYAASCLKKKITEQKKT